MANTIRASLAYTGHNVKWLAEQLGTTQGLIYKRLKDDNWTLHQLRAMKALFNWATLEG